MNEWMNDRRNEWMNEWIREGRKEGPKLTDIQMNKRTIYYTYNTSDTIYVNLLGIRHS